MNHGLFDQPELRLVHIALCFGDEIDMLDLTFVEGDRPVGIIVLRRRRNIEVVRKFNVNGHSAPNRLFLNRLGRFP